MKLRFAFFIAGGVLSSGALSGATGKPNSGIVSPEKRRVVVELGLRLARVPEPAALPPDLPHPFSPSNFEQPDPEELRAADAARANSAGGARGGVVGSGGALGPAAGGQALRPPSDREILESIAPKIRPTGTIKMGGEALLIFGRNHVKIGNKFTVADPASGKDHELELIAIDSTAFTLRFRDQEITRSIKSGKSP